MEAAEQRRQDHQFKADVKLIFMTSLRPEPQEILENTRQVQEACREHMETVPQKALA